MTDGANGAERIADGAGGDVGAVAVARGSGDARVVAVNPARNDVVSEQSAVISMIERAARDPAVDIDKLERLMGMRERMQMQTARAAFDEALANMQPELPIIDKRGLQKHNGNKYALWEDIAEGILSVTAKHGFSLSFRVKPSEKCVEVTAVLGHKAGYREETSYPFPLDTSGAKNPIQSVGSSISYGKRYTACAILNVITRGEDDDGKQASPQKSSSAAKKDGTATIFNEIKQEIASAINLEMLRHIGETRKDEIDAMPIKWRELLRDEYADKHEALSIHAGAA